jgi:hypothetical protein
MTFYHGLKYRVESTLSSWAGTWSSLTRAQADLMGSLCKGRQIVDETGKVIRHVDHGLMVPLSEYRERLKG